MEIYRLHVEEDQMVSLLSPITSPKTTGKVRYFGSDQEKEDVQKFWTQKWVMCDAVNLIEEFVYQMASRWRLLWPKELISIYIEAYNMFREHCDHPPLYRPSTSLDLLKKDALATVLFGELITFNNLE